MYRIQVYIKLITHFSTLALLSIHTSISRHQGTHHIHKPYTVSPNAPTPNPAFNHNFSQPQYPHGDEIGCMEHCATIMKKW